MAQRSIVLASASPRRRDLLREYGYEARIEPADIEEVMPAFLTVGEMTLLNAKRKCQHVARQFPDGIVVGADTLVSLDGLILGKPRDLGHAFEMLRSLSGRTHEVCSGVWIAGGEKSRGFVEVSRVKFHPLSTPAIEKYLARIGPLDKAGAYAAQDGGEVIQSIEGSLTNVVGLPMEALAAALEDFYDT